MHIQLRASLAGLFEHGGRHRRIAQHVFAGREALRSSHRQHVLGRFVELQLAKPIHVYQRTMRREGGKHMVWVNLMLPVATGNLTKMPMAPDGDELGLIEGKNFHLGLGRDHRVIGNVDVQRADLKGILEILATQVTPYLTKITASTLEGPQGEQADSSVRRQVLLRDNAQPLLYRLSNLQTLTHGIGFAQLQRLLLLELRIELPAYGQQTGFQRRQYGQQEARRQRSLSFGLQNAWLIGQHRVEPATYAKLRSPAYASWGSS